MSLVEQLAAELGLSPAGLAETLQQGTAAESLNPTYLSVDPTTGFVSALFTGSVQLQEATSNAFAPSHAIQWADAGGVEEFIQGVGGGGAHALLMATGAPNFTTNLQLISNPPANIVRVDAQAGNAVATLIDQFSRSNFLQLLSAQNLKLQFARTSGVALTSGADTNIPLTSAWPNTHLAFYATVLDAASGSDIVDNSNGRIFLDPGYGSGNYTITWFSLGN